MKRFTDADISHAADLLKKGMKTKEVQDEMMKSHNCSRSNTSVLVKYARKRAGMYKSGLK